MNTQMKFFCKTTKEKRQKLDKKLKYRKENVIEMAHR